MKTANKRFEVFHKQMSISGLSVIVEKITGTGKPYKNKLVPIKRSEVKMSKSRTWC
jgi:hypothetical protein